MGALYPGTDLFTVAGRLATHWRRSARHVDLALTSGVCEIVTRQDEGDLAVTVQRALQWRHSTKRQVPRTGDSLMSESFPLPTEPEDVIPSLMARFNSRQVEAM